jgi:hypothetical protein
MKIEGSLRAQAIANEFIASWNELALTDKFYLWHKLSDVLNSVLEPIADKGKVQ